MLFVQVIDVWRFFPNLNRNACVVREAPVAGLNGSECGPSKRGVEEKQLNFLAVLLNATSQQCPPLNGLA